MKKSKKDNKLNLGMLVERTALNRIKDIQITHIIYEDDESQDEEAKYLFTEIEDGTVKTNYPNEVAALEDLVNQVDNITSDYGLTLTEIDEILAETIGRKK